MIGACASRLILIETPNKLELRSKVKLLTIFFADFCAMAEDPHVWLEEVLVIINV